MPKDPFKGDPNSFRDHGFGGAPFRIGTRQRLFHHRGRNRGSAKSGVTRTFTPRPPIAAPGSDEAMLFAGNILYDPGFEIYAQNAVSDYLKAAWVAKTGSGSIVLPLFDATATPTGQRWPNGNAVNYFDIAQWAQFTEPYNISSNDREMSAWMVVRREVPLTTPLGVGVNNDGNNHATPIGPYLGKWMARWYGWDSSAAFGGTGVPGGLIIQAPGLPAGYSARTEQDALITWGIHAWTTEDNAATATLTLRFYQQNGTLLTTVSKTHSLGTIQGPGGFGYDTSLNLVAKGTEHTLTSNSPANSYYLRATVTFGGTGHRSLMVQVDSGILGVE